MHDLSLLNNLELFDWNKREQNLYNWAYTSWTVDEMSKPGWLEYYLRKAELIK